MTAPIVATPQLHTARDLKVVIDADLQARGIHVAVEVGAWSPELMRGEPRVTIELADATIGEPKGHYVSGAWWPTSPMPSFVGPVVATLDPSSTITHALAGEPKAAARVVVLFPAGGTTGANSEITYQVSIDDGAHYEDELALGDATAITVFGVTVDLGAGLVATAGDTLAWTQHRATSDLARPLLDDEQTYTLSIHAPSPGGVADVNAEAAQDATDQLMRAVMIGIRRQLAGPFRAAARATWPKKIAGYPSFVHGSLCVVTLVIGSPILDDAAGAGQAIQFEMDGTVNFGDGDVVVATALET